MSNSLAIAATTAALKLELQTALNGAIAAGLGVNAAQVLTTRPTATPPNGAGVHLYLWRITPDAALANDDLAFRDPGGRLTQRPVAALTLQYLLTFFGREDEVEAQRLAGVVAAHLHSRPYLTRSMVSAAVAAPGPPAVSASNLDTQHDVVRLTHVPLSLDDLSRIWAAMPSGSFGLSTMYEASPVLVSPPAVTSSPLPVIDRSVTVAQARPPAIATVERSTVPPTAGPIVDGLPVAITGENLAHAGLRVEIDGIAIPAATISSATDGEVVLAPPAGSIAAGVHSVQVIHVVAASASGTELTERSNLATFGLRPRTSAAGISARRVTATVAPAVLQQQEVSLTLHPLGGGPTVRLSRRPQAPPPTTAVEVDVPTGVPTGTYWLSAEVDGLAEVPTMVGGVFTGPQVVVP